MWIKIRNISELRLAIIIKMKNTSNIIQKCLIYFLTCKICLSTVIDSTTFWSPVDWGCMVIIPPVYWHGLDLGGGTLKTSTKNKSVGYLLLMLNIGKRLSNKSESVSQSFRKCLFNSSGFSSVFSLGPSFRDFRAFWPTSTSSGSALYPRINTGFFN